MTDKPGPGPENGSEMHAGNSPGNGGKWRIVSYNLREEERPGGPDGLKVRWKWRIETGPRARELDARQAAAIREALQWIRDHRSSKE